MGQHCFSAEHPEEVRPSRKIWGQRRGASSRLSQSSVSCSNLVAGLTVEAYRTPVIPVDLMLVIAPIQYAGGFLFSMFHYDDLARFVGA
jgi:hypothetical protein